MLIMEQIYCGEQELTQKLKALELLYWYLNALIKKKLSLRGLYDGCYNVYSLIKSLR